MKIVLALAAGLASAASGHAIGCDELDDVVGYTLVAATKVRGSFNGCENDRLIEFENGWVVRCAEYSYKYAYNPDAYIFGRKTQYAGHELTLFKACIDGELFDVRER